jgi:RNA polymerase sigma-70 factor, ECF subfamily
MLSELSSSELLQMCLRDSSGDVWMEFIRRYHPVISASAVRVARQYSLDAASAEDLVQEIYVKLCEKNCRVLREFQSDGPELIYGFLKVVSANYARDRCKALLAMKRGFQKTESLTTPEGDERAATQSDFADELEHGLFLERVRKLLNDLTKGPASARDQTVFWLYYLQGFTAREIADIPTLGLTAKGVESLLQRLVRHLRAELAKPPTADSERGIARAKSL